ncbi:MAG TPA: FixH family protein [Flavobacteriales bacterium]|nr:FixH family protein [Flavobacteriales bacterium]
MNWGKGLALALFAFAALMTWFVIKASQNPEPLVTEDYYGAELKFQERIDEKARAAALSAPVDMQVGRTSISLRFPEEMEGRLVTATLTLLRPNNPKADLQLPLSTDSARFILTDMDLVPGRYNATLEWEADGVVYLSQDKVYVP